MDLSLPLFILSLSYVREINSHLHYLSIILVFHFNLSNFYFITYFLFSKMVCFFSVCFLPSIFTLFASPVYFYGGDAVFVLFS